MEAREQILREHDTFWNNLRAHSPRANLRYFFRFAMCCFVFDGHRSGKVKVRCGNLALFRCGYCGVAILEHAQLGCTALSEIHYRCTVGDLMDMKAMRAAHPEAPGCGV